MAEMRDLYPTRKGTTPDIRSRQDPVVYSEWSEDAPLTRGEYESYRDNGFLFMPGLFKAEELKSLLDESARLRTDTSRLEPETLVSEPDSGDVRSIFALHRQSDVMQSLAADERLAGIAEFLLGEAVYIHQSRLNYKPGFRGKEFYWHSDFETWHAEDGMPRMRALSMSLLLTDNEPHNGPLMLVPGSHQTFVGTVGATPEDNYKSSLKAQETGVPDDENLARLYERHGMSTPTGPAGSLLIFDCNTLHGSASNISPLPRSNAFFVFNAVSNRLVAPFAAKEPRPEFIGARRHTDVVTPTRRNAKPLAA
ncbi:ectoine hydroxylase [Pararhizobium haloflavum]|uniref:ectoine hydroxylase n=1 Tax=Pararhizobium haloflavum TaxID=2037914 RepID=UPI001FDFD6A2|nr:ectoine hydroxylase [Pararhizobium haloflavum]